jgi:hypothetical protein
MLFFFVTITLNHLNLTFSKQLLCSLMVTPGILTLRQEVSKYVHTASRAAQQYTMQ